MSQQQPEASGGTPAAPAADTRPTINLVQPSPGQPAPHPSSASAQSAASPAKQPGTRSSKRRRIDKEAGRSNSEQREGVFSGFHTRSATGSKRTYGLDSQKGNSAANSALYGGFNDMSEADEENEQHQPARSATSAATRSNVPDGIASTRVKLTQALLKARTKAHDDLQQSPRGDLDMTVPFVKPEASAAGTANILELAKVVVGVKGASEQVLYYLARLHHSLVLDNVPRKRASFHVGAVVQQMKACSGSSDGVKFFTATANHVRDYPRAFNIINDEPAAESMGRSLRDFWLLDVLPLTGQHHGRANFNVWLRLHNLHACKELSQMSDTERAETYKQIVTGEKSVQALTNDILRQPQLPPAAGQPFSDEEKHNQLPVSNEADAAAAGAAVAADSDIVLDKRLFHDQKEPTRSKRKALVQLFMDPAVMSNIYRLTLVDGGTDDLAYTSLLDMHGVHQRFGVYGHVYHHLLVTCPLRWHTLLVGCFKIDAQRLLNLNSYHKDTDMSSVISLLNDSHQQPMQGMKRLMETGCMGLSKVSSMGESTIAEGNTVACTPKQVQEHEKAELQKQYTALQEGKLQDVRIRSSLPAPRGHAVVEHTSESDRLDAMITTLETEYVNSRAVWNGYEGEAAAAGHQQPQLPDPHSHELQRLCVIDAAAMELEAKWQNAIQSGCSGMHSLAHALDALPFWMPLAEELNGCMASLEHAHNLFKELLELFTHQDRSGTAGDAQPAASASAAAAHVDEEGSMLLSQRSSQAHQTAVRLRTALAAGRKSGEAAVAAAKSVQAAHEQFIQAAAAAQPPASWDHQTTANSQAADLCAVSLAEHLLAVLKELSDASQALGTIWSKQQQTSLPEVIQADFNSKRCVYMQRRGSISTFVKAFTNAVMSAPLEVSSHWNQLSPLQVQQLTQSSFTDFLRKRWSQQSPLNAELSMCRSSSLVPFLVDQLCSAGNPEAQFVGVRFFFLRHFCFSAQFMLDDAGVTMRTQPLLATRTLTQLSGHRFHVIISPGQEAKLSALALEVALRSNAAAHIQAKRTDQPSYPQLRNIYNKQHTQMKERLKDLASVLKWADVLMFSPSQLIDFEIAFTIQSQLPMETLVTGGEVYSFSLNVGTTEAVALACNHFGMRELVHSVPAITAILTTLARLSARCAEVIEQEGGPQDADSINDPLQADRLKLGISPSWIRTALRKFPPLPLCSLQASSELAAFKAYVFPATTSAEQVTEGVHQMVQELHKCAALYLCYGELEDVDEQLCSCMRLQLSPESNSPLAKLLAFKQARLQLKQAAANPEEQQSSLNDLRERLRVTAEDFCPAALQLVQREGEVPQPVDSNASVPMQMN